MVVGLSYLARSNMAMNDEAHLQSTHAYYLLLLSYLTLPSVSLKQFQASQMLIDISHKC
jgi:hypothetical protein